MRKIISLAVIIFAIVSCNGQSHADKKADTKEVQSSREKTPNIIHLTNETFKQKVFNYVDNKQWKYEGDKPAIIDFYADWCGPCRKVSPIVEELANEYSGKIVVYKVDTEVERELSQNLGIQSLPTLLFVPVNGKPQAAMGALPKSELVKAINSVLLVQ